MDDSYDSRYSRQVRFAGIGSDGQRRIADASVLVVGVGALGSHAAGLLARAGVGRMILIDRDVVEPSNLPRQTLFDEADAAAQRPKAIAAARHLGAVNSACTVVPLVEDFGPEVWEGLGARPDVVVDGTDNFATRMVINDLAVRDGVPWIHGGAVGAIGRALVVVPRRTPCLRCALPEPAPAGEVGTCETEGILATAVAHVAAFQATEALRLIVSGGSAFTRGVFCCDVWSGSFAVVLRDASPDPQCASCGTRALPALAALPDDAAVLCGRDAVQVRPRGPARVDLDRLAARLAGASLQVERTPHVLRFAADGCRITVFPGGRALVFGLHSAERARAVYDRWIGA